MRSTTQEFIKELKKAICYLETIEMLDEKIQVIHVRNKKERATVKEIQNVQRYTDMAKLCYEEFLGVIYNITATEKDEDKPEPHWFAVNKINDIHKQCFGI